MNYWFIYDLVTGKIKFSPYKGNATEWSNIPDGCGVIGPISEENSAANKAFIYPDCATVVDGEIIIDQDSWLIYNPESAENVLQRAIVAKISELDEACTKDIYGTFVSTAIDGNQHVFSFDSEAQLNFLGFKTELLGNSAAMVEWNTKDAGRFIIGKEQFDKLWRDAFAAKYAKMKKYRTLKDEVESCTRVEDVAKISY